jgi:hypothetical protein
MTDLASRRPLRRSRERGLLLGVVLVLLGIAIATGAFALWSMRGDTSAAGSDRMSRQLLDCAEQGLAYGKQYFAIAANQGTSLTQYLATNICAVKPTSGAGPLPCWTSTPSGPFPTGGTGPAITGYPITQQITMDVRQTSPDFEFTVAIYNDPAATSPYVYNPVTGTVVVYSRCTDLSTMQQRAVQAMTKISITTSADYQGQAGHGFRNQGNSNF